METYCFVHVFCAPLEEVQALFQKYYTMNCVTLRSSQKRDYTPWRSWLVLHMNQILFAVRTNNKFCSF